MKRNAITRIVLWGTVLLVLLAILFILIYVPGAGRRMRHETPVETAIAVPLTTSPVEETMVTATQAAIPAEASRLNAVATDDINVRTAPSTEAEVAGMVEKGGALQITRQELVNGILWGYTPAPVNGWVAMEYIELLEPIEENKTEVDAPVTQDQEVQGYGVALDAASIKKMEIEWAAGSIVIQPMDITEIRVSEESVAQSSDPMVWKVQEQKLSIQYSKNTDHDFGMGLLLGGESKNLIIQVPLDWQCNSLEIDAASASLEVNDLTIRELEFDGASGTCVLNNCTVESLELDTASGDVRFQGSLSKMDCDSASANIVLELSNIPSRLELDTASGDLDVTLPEGAGFTVTLETMSGEFDSDFTTTQRNGRYIAGDGRCQIEVEAMSGSVTIRKGP